MRRLIILLFCFAYTTECVFANAQGPKKQIKTTCPPASALKKNPNTNRWESTVYSQFWQSYNSSFLQNIEAFTGAQFIGNAQGHIACVYSGKRASSAFPVILHFGTLVHEPTSQNGLYKWEPIKNGWSNCISGEPADCSFSPVITTKDKNVYTTLENLKPSNILNTTIVDF